jgi:hypothetical protein
MAFQGASYEDKTVNSCLVCPGRDVKPGRNQMELLDSGNFAGVTISFEPSDVDGLWEMVAYFGPENNHSEKLSRSRAGSLGSFCGSSFYCRSGCVTTLVTVFPRNLPLL